MALSDINFISYNRFLEAIKSKYPDDTSRPTGFELESMFAGWLLCERTPSPHGWIPQLGEDVLVDDPTFGVGVVESFDTYPPTRMRVRAKATGISTTHPKEKIKPWRKQ